MSEKYKNVTTFRVSYACDVELCLGELLPTGNSDTNCKPPLYQHKCNKCGAIQVFEKIYPQIIYY